MARFENGEITYQLSGVRGLEGYLFDNATHAFHWLKQPIVQDDLDNISVSQVKIIKAQTQCPHCKTEGVVPPKVQIIKTYNAKDFLNDR